MKLSHESMPYGCVLVVDDIETNIRVAKGLLQPYGLEVDSAGSGEEAIRKIKNGRKYDVIFMDYMMPELNGVETLKRLRNMGYSRPVVAFTAAVILGEPDYFFENGFDDYIAKPVDTCHLNHVLNKLVRDRHQADIIEKRR